MSELDVCLGGDLGTLLIRVQGVTHDERDNRRFRGRNDFDDVSHRIRVEASAYHFVDVLSNGEIPTTPEQWLNLESKPIDRFILQIAEGGF